MKNPTLKYFDFCQEIPDKGGNTIAKVYIKNTDNSIGNVYTFHGYWGSPIDMLLKTVRDVAIYCNFNAIAVEACAASATDDAPKTFNSLGLISQKLATARALAWCRDGGLIDNELYNVAWAYSRACRVISDLAVKSKDTKTTVSVAKFFDEFVLCNPYFITPPKVLETIANMPPERLARISKIPFKKTRNIDGVDYTCRSYLGNLVQDLPTDWGVKTCDLQDVATVTYNQMQSIRTKPLTILLGSLDAEAEYEQNRTLADYLPFALKQVDTIVGAGHYFEEKPTQYRGYVDGFFHTLQHTVTR